MSSVPAVRRFAPLLLRLAGGATVLWADERDYTSAAQMLHALGANRIGLLSNNPDKGAQLARLGITIARQVPTALHLTGTNAAYLAAKAQRGGHDLLSRGLDRAAEAHWPACPLASPADLGAESG